MLLCKMITTIRPTVLGVGLGEGNLKQLLSTKLYGSISIFLELRDHTPEYWPWLAFDDYSGRKALFWRQEFAYRIK